MGFVTFLVWHKTVKPELGQTVVLALTAWVILWYTVETMRLRREAEAREKRDREPHIYFDVEQPTRMPTAAGERHRSGFIFENHSSNEALACVRVRLRIAEGPPILISNAAYDGRQIWEVTPFFKLRGVFDLQDFTGFRPSRDTVLNVQVDLYWTDRTYLATLKKEYHVGLSDVTFEEFWPEVTTSLPLLPHSNYLSRQN